MRQLTEIAKDYASVKNYVYRRYGGIRSVAKLNSKYAVQNEMTSCGLRQELGLPGVYYYPAVAEALADIKTGWAQVKAAVVRRAMQNENFTPDEQHYVCRILRKDSAFAEVLMGRQPPDGEIFGDLVSRQPALNNYIRRQVRKLLPEFGARKTSYFRVTVKGYLYDHGAIRLTTKVKRKRIAVLLTDRNEYGHQLEIGLFPEERRIVINVPVVMREKNHPDFTEEIGVAMGLEAMFTASTGRIYGGEYGSRRAAQLQKLDRMNARHKSMAARYSRYLAEGELSKAENIEKNNLGRQKYDDYKRRSEIELKGYVNAEIERLLRQEKPSVIYLAKLPPPGPMERKLSGALKRRLSQWQRGYIKERLTYKCMENSVKLIPVFAKGSGSLCSACGETGAKADGVFTCKACGRSVPAGQNAAENILRLGQNAERSG